MEYSAATGAQNIESKFAKFAEGVKSGGIKAGAGIAFVAAAVAKGTYDAVKAGAAMTGVQDAFTKAAKAVSSGNEAISDLGLSFDDLLKKTPSEQFVDIANAFQKIPNPAKRSADAMKIFGDQGMSFLKAFESGAFAGVTGKLTATNSALVNGAKDFKTAADALAGPLIDFKGFFAGFAAGIIKPLNAALGALGTVSSDLAPAGAKFASYIVAAANSLGAGIKAIDSIGAADGKGFGGGDQGAFGFWANVVKTMGTAGLSIGEKIAGNVANGKPIFTGVQDGGQSSFVQEAVKAGVIAGMTSPDSKEAFWKGKDPRVTDGSFAPTGFFQHHPDSLRFGLPTPGAEDLQNFANQMGFRSGAYGSIESRTSGERRGARDARIQNRFKDDPENSDQMSSAYHRIASRSFLNRHGAGAQKMALDQDTIDKIAKAMGDNVDKVIAKP